MYIKTSKIYSAVKDMCGKIIGFHMRTLEDVVRTHTERIEELEAKAYSF